MNRVRPALALLVVVVVAGCGGPVRVEGNQNVADRELLAAARRPIVSWKEEGHRAADLYDAAEAMRSHLADLGFAGAEVDFTAIAEAGAEPSARFTVREGARSELGRISFPGSIHLDRRLLDALEEALRPWYVAASVEAAAARIERLYRSEGYITARVGEPLLTWNSDQSRVDVAFPVSEGRRYTIAKEELDLVGKPVPGAAEALATLLDPPGTVYDLRLGVRTANRLRGWLQARGHSEATVSVIDHLDTAAGTASPVFRVVAGPVHLRGALDVRNRGTSSGFILRRLKPLKAGQPIDQSVLDGAVAGLYSTGLFTNVEVKKTDHAPGPDGTVVTDLGIAVTQAKTRRLDVSIGYGSYEQLRGGADYVDDHLFGQGLRLHGGVNASLKGWGADLGLSDPFRFGPGRTVGTELGYREREEPSFSHREFTGTIEGVQRIRPAFDDARWELRSQYEYKLAEDFAIDGALTESEIDGFYRTSTISGQVRRDARGPRLVDPRHGTLVQLRAGWNAKLLGSDVPYTELGGEWSGYLRLGRGLTGSLRVGGTVRNPSDELNLPIGERLFLGGEDSVRSFTQDQLGPADASGDPVGGLSSGVANAELRWRPWRGWPNVELAGFYDIGAIGQRPWTLDSPPGHAVGGGLRYLTPVGPIRLDAAYNPGERFAANDVYAVHFAVGFAF